MSKQKKPDKRPNPSENESNLTPWQKANRKYLAEHGKAVDKKENKEQQEETTHSSDEQAELTEKGMQESKIPELKEADTFEKIEQPKTGSPYNGSFLNRLPNLKNQRNKVLYRRLAFIITILSIPLIFLIYYVSPYSRLQAISVSGNEMITKQTVIADTSLKIGGNVWRQYWQKDQYIARLKKEQPRIETAHLHFKSINTFQLDVKEYKEIALVVKDGQYFPVLENGKIVNEKVANPTKNLPILENFKDDNKVSSLVKEYNKLSSELQKAISEIKYTPKDSNKNLIQLNMNDGNQVIVNIQNLASQMKYYSQVAKEMKEKGVIDMEVGIFSYPYTDRSEETDSSVQMNSTDLSTSQQGESSASSDQSSVTNETDQSDHTSETSQDVNNSSSSSSISTIN